MADCIPWHQPLLLTTNEVDSVASIVKSLSRMITNITVVPFVSICAKRLASGIC